MAKHRSLSDRIDLMQFEIPLDKFLAEHRGMLERFEKYWREDPENCPLTLLRGDWSEQLLMFASMDDEALEE